MRVDGLTAMRHSLRICSSVNLLLFMDSSVRSPIILGSGSGGHVRPNRSACTSRPGGDMLVAQVKPRTSGLIG